LNMVPGCHDAFHSVSLLLYLKWSSNNILFGKCGIG
jgi:hypothetical protein